MPGLDSKMPEVLRLEGNLGTQRQRWLQFKRQYQDFLAEPVLRRLSDASKSDIFLNFLGPEAKSLYVNVFNKAGEIIKHEDMIQRFDEHFTAKHIEMITTFNARKQQDGETFDIFYDELRKLIKKINYPEQKEEIKLRDRLVFGVQDKNLRLKLMEKNDLTLQDAVSICRAFEHSKEEGRTPTVDADKAFSAPKDKPSSDQQSKASIPPIVGTIELFKNRNQLGMLCVMSNNWHGIIKSWLTKLTALSSISSICDFCIV